MVRWGDTAQLPDGATDVVTAIAKQNSDEAELEGCKSGQKCVAPSDA